MINWLEAIIGGPELTATGPTEKEQEHFNFSSPEDVLIQVIRVEPEGPDDDWTNFSIEEFSVIRGKEGVTGAAEYDRLYGAGLDYTLRQIIDPPGEGWFVVEGVTGVYHKGDGWMADDDMDFYCTGVRPATEEDMRLL